MASGSSERVATRGLSNLLIRRVMRHRNVATLFHSAASEVTPIAPAALEPNTVIVAAVPILFPDADAFQVQALPSITMPFEEWAGEGDRSAPTPPAHLLGTRQAAPAGDQERRSAPSLSPSAPGAGQVGPAALDGIPAAPALSPFPIVQSQPVPTTAETVPSATPPPPSALEVRQGLSTPRDGAPTVLRAVAGNEADHPLESRPALRRAAVPPGEEASTTPLSAQTPPDTAITAEVWHRLRTIFQRHQERDKAPGPEPAQPAEVAPLPVPNQAPNAVTTSAPPDASSETLDQVVTPRAQPAVARPVDQPATAAEPPVSVADGPQEIAAQVLPLQDVWNVEPVPSRPSAASAQPGATPALPPQAESDTAYEPVRQVLDRIAPGGATRSTIETLPPRQPRPRTQTPAIARTPAAINPATPLTDRTAEPPLVQTAIGPLPADLWDLIGAPLPSAVLPSVPLLRSLAPDQPDITDADQDGTDHVSAGDTLVGHATVHHAAADPAAKRDSYRHPVTRSNAPSPETSAAPGVPSGVTRTPGSGPIQRVLAPSASSAAATGTATTADTAVAAPLSESAQAPQAAESSGGTTPGTGQEPDIDIAELARRVYAEIKRRLRVERERSPWH